MIQHLSAHRIANSILIDSSRKETTLLVEGINDNLLYSKFCDSKKCEIKIAFGYQNIHEIIEIINNSGVAINVIGILDQDFLNIESTLPVYPNAFFIDSHDLEMMAFQTKAFEILLVNYGDQEKINSLTTQRGKNIRVILMEIISPLALLKYLNFKYKIGLAFKPKDLSSPKLKYDFIDHNSFTFISNEKLVEIVYNYNTGKRTPTLNRKDCIALMEKYKEHAFDLNLLCNGHDLCKLISISLRRHISSMGSKAVQEEDIEQRLVLAFDSSDFKNTNIYRDIKNYELTNSLKILTF